MIRLGLLFLFLLFENTLFASHMVGGGFRYSHVVDNKYLIQLDYHKDCSANAVDYPPGAVRIGIYRKSDNTLVQSLDLNPGPISIVNFISDTCVKSEVTCVQKRVYEDTLYLNTSLFNDSTGYYLSYEQCCRNFGIKNIADPDKSGLAFYAEFVPFTNSNQGFRNSSPYLINEQNVYLCVQEFYAASYEHVDPDGDSLVYKLIEPLIGTTDPVFNNSNGISVLNPKPYPSVNWSPGYGFTANNIMDGQPDLKMDSSNGLLTINPFQPGMYSFAYAVEEYRDGKLLATYNREVQYYVVFCAKRNKPALTLVNPNDTVFNSDSIKCILIKANDIDLLDTIQIRMASISSRLAKQYVSWSVDTLNSNDFLIKLCIRANCNIGNSTNESITFIVNDNSCPFILYDTLNLNLSIESRINQKPNIVWSNPTTNQIKTNKKTCLEFYADDADSNDSLIIQLSELSAVLSNLSIEERVNVTSKNKVSYTVCFDTDCNLINSNAEGFKLKVFDSFCVNPLVDSIYINLSTENLGTENLLDNIPNVFTPNGDGINDKFKIQKLIEATCVEDFMISIYNRWGEKVYTSDNFLFEWSGEGLSAGVYFYVIQLGKQEKIGHISIMY